MEKTNKSVNRFWAKVNVKDDQNQCWEWNAATSKSKDRENDGYGIFSIKNDEGKSTMIGAHRYSMLLKQGSLTPGMMVIHSCDNPKCVNPNHLREGTPKENSQDCVQRNRRAKDKPGVQGEAHPAARLKLEEAKFILYSEMRQKDLAEMFNVSPHHISLIKSGQKWAKAIKRSEMESK